MLNGLQGSYIASYGYKKYSLPDVDREYFYDKCEFTSQGPSGPFRCG